MPYNSKRNYYFVLGAQFRRNPIPCQSTPPSWSSQMIDLTDDTIYVDAVTNQSTNGTENKTDTVEGEGIMSHVGENNETANCMTRAIYLPAPKQGYITRIPSEKIAKSDVIMSNFVEKTDTADRRLKTSSPPPDQDYLETFLYGKTVKSVGAMLNIVEETDTADRRLNTYSPPLDQDYIDRFLSEILNDTGSNY